MDRKYELLKNDYIIHEGRKLYRIRALRNLACVNKGDVGGYIEKESNLSHEGNCWIFNNAKVYDNAEILDHAFVYDNAEVYNNAKIFDNAEIFDNAKVYGNVMIFDSSMIYGDAQVYGDACIRGYVEIFDNAKIHGNTLIYEYANIYGNAEVYGRANIYGNAEIYGNAKVYGSMLIKCGKLETDCFTDMNKLLQCSLGLAFVNDEVILYKRVNKIREGKYRSVYDPNFIYEDGKIAIAEDVDEDKTVSCGGGLHVSTVNYWNEGDTLIACLVKKEDVITIQNGKVRCRKLKVLGEVK